MTALALLAVSGGALLIYCGLTGKSPLQVLASLFRGGASALKVAPAVPGEAKSTHPGGGPAAASL